MQRRPGVFGPPKDKNAALEGAPGEAGVAAGVNHIDTSDFYGPHVTNQLIREAHPVPGRSYPRPPKSVRDAMIKARGCRPFPHRSWRAVHDNLRNLRLDVLDVVNLRIMFSARTGGRHDR